MSVTIKKGATFEAKAVFTADEWAAVHPWTAITATVKQGTETFTLTTTTDALNRVATFNADTSNWELGRFSFDIKIVKGNETIYLPGTRNIDGVVIEGVS